MIPIRLFHFGSSPEYRAQPVMSGAGRAALTLFTFISLFLFPWPLTVLLVLASAPFEPFVPLAAGLLADTLYYAPSAHAMPFFTLCGAAVTLIVFFVRSRLVTT